MITDRILNTELFEAHIKLGAKMVPFAGYNMPINYSKGIKHEYFAVRNNVGVFDVSHMGEIKVEGENSKIFLQNLTVNDISKLNIGDAQYNLICNDQGGIKDDIILYMLDDFKFLLIVNASNCNKIFNWMQKVNHLDVNIENKSMKYSLIAIQGPASRTIISEVFNHEINLKFYKHKYIKFNNDKILLSRTGYTGELGFEIMGRHQLILNLWTQLIKKGVEPCGLAVRDVLRMEMKYCLYGNDIDEDVSPLEAGLNWVVQLSKEDFIGKNILNNQNKNGINKKLICFKMLDKCIPRKGYKIYCKNNKEIGKVTSGTYSIGLKYGIGMGYINTSYSSKDLFIELRNRQFKGTIVKPPFIEKFSLHS